MICFRFDIDTRRGLVERVPPLLELLDEHGIRATFFCVLGREANLVEIVRLRFLAPKEAKSPLNVGAKGGLVRLALAALWPRRVGTAHPELLRDIVGRGHELGPHGWSHIRWQRDLANVDVATVLGRCLDTQRELVGVDAAGWASPGRSWDTRVLEAIDGAGLVYGGDLDGARPFRPDGSAHLQLPVTRFETIAQMRRRGLSDAAIVDAYLGDIDANPDYCCLYEHPDDLDDAGLAIFGRVFAEVAGRGLATVTLAEAAASWDATRPR